MADLLSSIKKNHISLEKSGKILNYVKIADAGEKP
jgi:hypothetical protein